MTFEEVYKRIIALDDDLLQGWRQSSLIYWSNALAGEAGEVCNATKKALGGGTKGDDSGPERIRGELVDVITYAILYWERLGGNCDDLVGALSVKNKVNFERMAARGKVKVEW